MSPLNNTKLMQNNTNASNIRSSHFFSEINQHISVLKFEKNLHSLKFHFLFLSRCMIAIDVTIVCESTLISCLKLNLIIVRYGQNRQKSFTYFTINSLHYFEMLILVYIF